MSGDRAVERGHNAERGAGAPAWAAHPAVAAAIDGLPLGREQGRAAGGRTTRPKLQGRASHARHAARREQRERHHVAPALATAAPGAPSSSSSSRRRLLRDVTVNRETADLLAVNGCALVQIRKQGGVTVAPASVKPEAASWAFPYQAARQVYVPGVVGAVVVKVARTSDVVQPPSPPGQELLASSTISWSYRFTRSPLRRPPVTVTLTVSRRVGRLAGRRDEVDGALGCAPVRTVRVAAIAG